MWRNVVGVRKRKQDVHEPHAMRSWLGTTSSGFLPRTKSGAIPFELEIHQQVVSDDHLLCIL